MFKNVLNDFLSFPSRNRRVLLHSCCAPCSGEIMEVMSACKIEYSVLFYNPNIHPKKEYQLRKFENMCFAEKLSVPFIDLDYDSDNWFKRVRGMELEPERGKRCTVCFDIRLERTALYAYENDFSIITTSLGISRWKNIKQVGNSGLNAVFRYFGMIYWNLNWRKSGGSERMIEVSRREGFYRQKYCGCIYSLRDSKCRMN